MTSILPPGNLTDLKDKAVLITGGSSGIGLETAQLFVSNGAWVTVADVQPPLEDLKKSGHHVHLDVVATFAAVDPLENLIDQINTTTNVSLDADPAPPSLRTIDINLNGSYYSAALALHYFRFQAQGPPPTTPAPKALIFVSSLAGYLDDDHNIAYTTSKFATRGLFRALRRRTAKDFTPGVRVNLIAPWAVKTPMTAPILKLMAGMGIQEGQGITFTEMKTCAQAVARCAVDERIHGRAFAIMPEGAFDIKDDIDGGYGGDELKILMSWRKAAGDFLQG